jgi:hypothetical protein
MDSRLLSRSRYPLVERVIGVAFVVTLVGLSVGAAGHGTAKLAGPPTAPPGVASSSDSSQVTPHLIVEFLSGDPAGFNYVLNSIAPHLLPGDYVNIYDFAPCCAINPPLVGAEASQLRAVVPSGVTLTANTGLISNVQQMAAAKPTDVTGIAATYEPDGATAPGTYNFTACLDYFSQVNQIDHAAGLTSIAYPTGHPLLTQRLQSYGWNYGEIAQLTDLVWVETQEYARQAVNDSSVWTSAVAKLIAQFQGAGEPLSKLALQVSLGNDGHGTGTDPAVALVAIKMAVAMGIQNIYLWTSQGYESNLGTLITSLDRSSVITHTVTFTESGLPSGTNWSVTLNGSVRSSHSSAITFTEPNGSLGFSVLSPTAAENGTRFEATPSTGSVDVSGANVTVPIGYGPQYYLQAVASPVGDGTVSPAKGWYGAGHTVSVLATPASGDSFSSWSGEGAGSYNGTSNPASVTVLGPINETAQFTPTSPNLVTVTFTETGLPRGTTWNVRLNGQWEGSSNATVEFRVSNGSYGYAIGSPVSGANPGTRYVTAPTTGTVVVGNSSVTVSVAYVTEYNLSVSVSPVGSGRATPLGGWFAPNSEVALSATPTHGYRFSVWVGTGSGNYTGTDRSPHLTMAGPVDEVAEFVPTNVTSTLSLQETGLPLGTSWTAQVGGSNWTTNQTTITIPLLQGSVGYAVESPIPVSANLQYVAEPSSGTVNLTGGSVAVTVRFDPEALLVGRSSGAGTVTVAPEADGWYLFGTHVELKAVEPLGSVFVGWNGSGNGSYSGPANPVELDVAGPIVEVAHFRPAVSSSPTGGNPFGGDREVVPVVVVPAMLFGAVLGTVLAMNLAVRIRVGSRGRPKRR